MDCRDARRLLDQGVKPGAQDATRASLGFHLSSCPACRSYRANPDEFLLLSLLTEEPVRSGTRLRPRPGAQPRLQHWRRYAALTALATVLVCGVYVLGSALWAVLTIQRNVQAMQLPRPPTDHSAPLARTAPTTPPLMMGPPAPPRIAGPPLPMATLTPMVSADNAMPEARLPPRPTPLASPTSAIIPTEAPLPTLMPTLDLPPSGTAINVLLLGVDRRPDEEGPSRTDAIAVARIEPESGRIALLSLPRDLIVPIPGVGSARINSASMYGELNPQLGGGVELTRATVSNLLGIPIDHVVQIDFQGFIGAIDSIGGVTVNVERELYDPLYPTMDYGYTVAHFLPGPQQMDGTTALMYSRVRHMDSDFERLRRQQAVMVGVLNRLREQNALEQLQSIAAITGALSNYVQTDLPQSRIVALAWLLRDINPDSIERYTLDVNMVAMNVIPGDPYAEVPLPGAIETLVQQLLHGPTP